MALISLLSFDKRNNVPYYEGRLKISKKQFTLYNTIRLLTTLVLSTIAKFIKVRSLPGFVLDT